MKYLLTYKMYKYMELDYGYFVHTKAKLCEKYDSVNITNSSELSMKKVVLFLEYTAITTYHVSFLN